ncbi:MAG: hypothetical protein ACRDMV_10840 [Streptosporangiales bacterium]
MSTPQQPETPQYQPYVYQPQQPTPPRQPRNHRHRWFIFGGTAAVVAALAIALSLTLAGSSTFTMHGSMLVTDLSTSPYASPSVLAAGDEGSPCYTSGGYGDIAPGVAVKVTDAAGKQIGLGTLQAGKTIGPGGCAFPFTVKDVPLDKKSYGIEISHRGTVVETPQQAKTPALSLGGN